MPEQAVVEPLPPSSLTDERKAELHAFWEGQLSGKVPPKVLPIPEKAEEILRGIEREYGVKRWPAETRKRHLEDFAQSFYYPSTVLVIMKTKPGVVVLAVGSEEMGEFHSWCPHKYSGRTITTWTGFLDEEEVIQE